MVFLLLALGIGYEEHVNALRKLKSYAYAALAVG